MHLQYGSIKFTVTKALEKSMNTQRVSVERFKAENSKHPIRIPHTVGQQSDIQQGRHRDRQKKHFTYLGFVLDHEKI